MRSKAGTQCSGRYINDTMRAEGDVHSLLLGGFVTSHDFVHAAQRITAQRCHNARCSPCIAASSIQISRPRIAAYSSRLAPKGRQPAGKRKCSAMHSSGVPTKAPRRSLHDPDSADDSD